MRACDGQLDRVAIDFVTLHSERRAKSIECHVNNLVVSFSVMAVGDAANTPRKSQSFGIISTQNCGSINLSHELFKGFLQLRPTAVVLEVIRLNIGDYPSRCAQSEKGAIAFIGLDNKPITAVPLSTIAPAAQLSADDPRGLHACGFHSQREKGRRCGLAVSACNRNRLFDRCDLSEDLKPSKNWNAPLNSSYHLRVGFGNGGRPDHGLGRVWNALWGVASPRNGPCVTHSIEHRRFCGIASRDRMAHCEQDLRNGTHPRSPSTHDMDGAGRGEIDSALKYGVLHNHPA